MKMRTSFFASLLMVGTIVGATSTAQAIPAFARRYGTSCQTCHIAFPKLTPFGEAFRRNGYAFPGQDEDFAKQDQIPMGQDAYRQMFPNAVWPGVLAASGPFAMSFNGSAVVHPTRSSSAAQADNRAVFSLENLVEEAHLYAGGTFSEHIAYYAEVTFAGGGTDIEHAELHFNDLGLSPHLVNLYVGRGFPSLTSFGAHSSYIADQILPALSVAALYGSPDASFNTLGQYNLVELNGMSHGRFIYSVGVNNGANIDTRTSQNVAAHLGFKVGGMRLDGENATGTGNPLKPWEETALTVDLFGTRSASHFTNAVDATMSQDDLTYVLGGHLRGTVGSFELDSGVFQEWHNHATDTATGVKALAQWDELSYVVFPWLVPAVRMEYVSLLPDGGTRLNDVLFSGGAACLIRPNLKVTLVGFIEHSNGAPVPGPTGGWSLGSDGFAAPMAEAVTEFEQIQIGLAYAM